jgi:prepilin-type N-terminal cleavage/methylation domain-containing protein
VASRRVPIHFSLVLLQYMSRKAFTLVEVLVGTGIMGLLLSILLPGLSRVKEQADRIRCVGHLRQVHGAVASYAASNRSVLPLKYEYKKTSLTAKEVAEGKRINRPDDGIQTLLKKHAAAPENFRCPEDVGSARDASTPMWEQIGTSFEVHGAGPQESNPLKRRLTPSAQQKVANDLFKPWDSDDPAKVLEKLNKGEHAPIRWHRKQMHRVYGDGRVVAVIDKVQEKLEEGKQPDSKDED